MNELNDIWTDLHDIHNSGSPLPWFGDQGSGATVPGNFGNNSFSPSEIEDLLECIYGLSGSNGEGTGDYFEGYLGFTTQDLYPEEFEFLSEHPNVTGVLVRICGEFEHTEATVSLMKKFLGVAMEIEVKGRFSTAPDPIFDYSSQQSQLQDYLNYLQGNAYNSTVAGWTSRFLVVL
ncbi:MAG: hypothetical protein CV087_23960 [Candidatus Brocadia sp. WS118]|nr:MAG: hypothetical protein CV087_23960 [Candidatus Brocadia sp. WS118]